MEIFDHWITKASYRKFLCYVLQFCLSSFDRVDFVFVSKEGPNITKTSSNLFIHYGFLS